MSRTRLIALTAIVAALAWTAALSGAAGGLERLYVLDCGQNIGKDQSRWSPGVNEGKSIEFSDNCYLIRHAKGWLLWDTGIPAAVAAMPDGMVVANGAITQRRAKTPAAQGAEYEWAMTQPVKPAFAATQPIEKLTGDRDVFGDGSVMILSTPGHTPGHQSLLVVLAKSGPVLLSGDAVHFRDNWENRRVPSMNFNREQTVASMQRIASVLETRKAQLWINHDKAQSAQLRYAPAFYE